MKNGLLSCCVALLIAASAIAACGETETAPASSDDAGTPVADAGASGDDAGTPVVDAGDPGSGDGGSGGPTTRPGLEGYCDRYKECGGTYYDTAQECIDASISYWGEGCRAELDAFGECMKTIPCSDYDPDAYNPASTDCDEEWSTLRGSDC